MRRETVMVALCAALVLAGCEGDGSDSDGGSAKPSSGSPGTSTGDGSAPVDPPAGPGVDAVKALFTTPPLLPEGVEKPNPMRVDVTLDTESATTATVPAETGGSLEATAGDGTRYVLSIPDDALLFDTEITMTPVAAAAGFDVPGTTLAGVQLEPDGLRLYDWATIEVFPASGDARQPALAYGYHGDGQELHGQPLALDPDRIVVDVLHFSGDLIHLGEGIYVSADTPAVQPTTPSDWESQIRQAMQDLLAAERQAQLLGLEGDPQLWEKIQQLMDLYYDKIVAPVLERMVRDCEYAQANAHTPLSWARQSQLLGLGEDDPRQAKVMDALVKSIENCWDEAMKGCIDVKSAEAVQKVLGLARQGQLLGGSEDRFDPSLILDPESEPSKICGDAFGTIVWHHVYHAEPQPSWNAVKDWDEVIVAEINLQSDGDGGFEDKGSTFTWNGHQHSTSHAGKCSRHVGNNVWTGSGQFSDDESLNRSISFGVDGEDASLSIWVDGVMKGRRVTTNEDVDGNCYSVTDEYTQGPEEWPAVMFCPTPYEETVPGSLVRGGSTIDFSCEGSEEGPLNEDGHYTRTVTVSGTLTIR